MSENKVFETLVENRTTNEINLITLFYSEKIIKPISFKINTPVSESNQKGTSTPNLIKVEKG